MFCLSLFWFETALQNKKWKLLYNYKILISLGIKKMIKIMQASWVVRDILYKIQIFIKFLLAKMLWLAQQLRKWDHLAKSLGNLKLMREVIFKDINSNLKVVWCRMVGMISINNLFLSFRVSLWLRLNSDKEIIKFQINYNKRIRNPT